MREAPQTLLPKLFKAWKVSHLVFEKDTDAYGRSRDTEIIKLAKAAGVEIVFKTGRTLYDSDELVEKNGGKPTMSISQVEHAGAKIGDIARPISPPRSLPDPGDTPLDFEQDQPPQEPDFNAIQRDGQDTSYTKLAGPNGDFAVPTMEELGLKPATTKYRGGETNALETLAKVLADKDYTAKFEKPKTAPTAFEPQSTTLLSPHLHFGSLSCREFYWRVQDVIKSYKGNPSSLPVNLPGQLLFRDMYFGAQAPLGYKFGQTFGNSHCRFVPWHLRSKVDPKFGLITGEYSIDNAQAEEWFQRWKYGCTGFPWIDAVMRQLRTEGWIHHLARHAVACFLTRGGCYIDWERGAEVFEEWLIDHEAACNIGNWQWLSCTAFYAQFYRCYSPIAFPQKTDKNGDFVRRYVPELEDFPAKYIYEPWKAPIQDQRKAGCLIKGDGKEEEEEKADGYKIYPKPMFDFNERRAICIEGLKNAYKVKLYGNDPRVLDGTWRELFDVGDEGVAEGDDTSAIDGESKIRKEVKGKGGKGEKGVDEDEGGAADAGGENKGGDKGGNKRKRGDGKGTLDGFISTNRKKLRKT
ncbi:MAG: hypothetical protein MMC33_005455 [Icmadophila ericetorum]|nr:hypothetical protein [Icmadophila ericetorum]